MTISRSRVMRRPTAVASLTVRSRLPISLYIGKTNDRLDIIITPGRIRRSTAEPSIARGRSSRNRLGDDVAALPPDDPPAEGGGGCLELGTRAARHGHGQAWHRPHLSLQLRRLPLLP